MSRSPRIGVRRSHLSVWLVVLVGLAVVLASALLAGGARSASQPQGVIAFSRFDDHDVGVIYVMRSDGSGIHAIRRLSQFHAPFRLDWSPDGRRLAFDTWLEGHSPPWETWVMNADGSHPVRLVKGGHSPTWSPDGRKIAFCADRLPGWKGPGIWVMNADGTHLKRVLRVDNAAETALQVDWGHTDGRIAFIRGTTYQPRLAAMNANGTGARELLNDAMEPNWSPDGHRIVFSFFKDWTSVVSLVNGDGQGQVNLTQGKLPDRDPTWSPDGRKIAFVRWSKGLRPHGIFVMNADGTGATRLAHSNRAYRGLAWQPVPR